MSPRNKRERRNICEERVLAILLCAAMTMSMVACGGESKRRKPLQKKEEQRKFLF